MLGDDAEDRIDVDRGLRASALLENELLTEAWAVLDKRLWEQFRATPSRDAEAREYIHKLNHVMRDFRGYFEEVVHSGARSWALFPPSPPARRSLSAP